MKILRVGRVGGALLAVALLALPLQVTAQGGKLRDISKGIKEKAGGSAKDFITGAITDRIVDGQLAKLGAQKSNNSLVKRFARSALSHSQTQSEELGELARKKGVDAPKAADAEGQSSINRLSGLSGEDFDRGFLSEMIKRKGTQLVGLRRQASAGADEETSSWAQKVIPVERETLNRAREIGGKIGLK